MKLKELLLESILDETELYHGGLLEDIKDGVLYLTPVIEIAESYSSTIYKIQLNPNYNFKELDIRADYTFVKEVLKNKYPDYNDKKEKYLELLNLNHVKEFKNLENQYNKTKYIIGKDESIISDISNFENLSKVIREVENPKRNDVYANWKYIIATALEKGYNVITHITETQDRRAVGIEYVLLDPKNQISNIKELS